MDELVDLPMIDRILNSHDGFSTEYQRRLARADLASLREHAAAAEFYKSETTALRVEVATFRAEAEMLRKRNLDLALRLSVVINSAQTSKRHAVLSLRATVAAQATKLEQARSIIPDLLDVPNIFPAKVYGVTNEYCQYCRANSTNMYTIDHDEDCPVSIARAWLASTAPAPDAAPQREGGDE